MATTDCINLQRMCGEQYKVAYEESYYAEHGENAYREDPWLMIIPCVNGHICPWGGSNLAACTDRSGSVAMRLRKLPFLDLSATQDGSDGINAVFDVKHFAEVARIMQPRKRRRLSPEQKQRLAEVGAKSRFPAGTQAGKSGQECVPAGALV